MGEWTITCGPMNNSISMVPATCFGEPSYALAVIVLGKIWVGSTDISSSTCFESMYKLSHYPPIPCQWCNLGTSLWCIEVCYDRWHQARLWWSIGSSLTWISLETPVTTHYMFQMAQGPRQKHWMHWFWRFQPSQIWRAIGVSRGAQSNLIWVMRWGENIAKETKKSYYNSETTWMARINGLHGRLQISLQSAL